MEIKTKTGTPFKFKHQYISIVLEVFKNTKQFETEYKCTRSFITVSIWTQVHKYITLCICVSNLQYWDKLQYNFTPVHPFVYSV